MASGRSLTPEENARVVAAIRAALEASGDTQTTLAPRLGIKQPTLSALLAGKHQAGYALARRVAQVRDVHVDDLLSGAPDGADAALRDDAPVFANLPGWADAAKEFARLRPWMPTKVIVSAGRTSALDFRGPVTWETVAKVAQMWLDIYAPADLAEQVEVARVDAQIAKDERDYRSAQRRRRRGTASPHGPANETGGPAGLPAPAPTAAGTAGRAKSKAR